MRVKLMVPNGIDDSLHIKAKAIEAADSAKLRGFYEFVEQMKADFGTTPKSRFKYCGNLLGWLWLGPKDSQDLYLHIEGNVLLWEGLRENLKPLLAMLQKFDTYKVLEYATHARHLQWWETQADYLSHKPLQSKLALALSSAQK